MTLRPTLRHAPPSSFQTLLCRRSAGAPKGVRRRCVTLRYATLRRAATPRRARPPAKAAARAYVQAGRGAGQ